MNVNRRSFKYYLPYVRTMHDRRLIVHQNKFSTSISKTCSSIMRYREAIILRKELSPDYWKIHEHRSLVLKKENKLG